MSETTWPKAPPRNPALPACAHCGYPVKGLPSFTCPECGKDLREVGITAPRRRDIWKRRSLFLLSAVSTTLLAMASVLRLRPPVQRAASQVWVRRDGRVIFDPPLTLPMGRHRVLMIWRAAPEDEIKHAKS